MLAATDYAGIAAVITSVFAGIIGVLTLYRTTQVHTEVKNPNGTTTGKSIESIRQTVNAPENPVLPAPPHMDDTATGKSVESIRQTVNAPENPPTPSPPQ